MISLFILILILVTGITVMGYYQMERTADEMLKILTNERRPPEMNGRPPSPMFGYQINESNILAGHFIAVLSDDYKVLTIEFIGMTGNDKDEAVKYVNEALASGKNYGKVGSYKYLLNNTKPIRMFFLDNSLQVRMLVNTVTASCLAGLGCMILMFIILFLVSGRVIQPIAHSIEKQRQFVSNAGHEIKTPLGIIMANTDAMELHVGENRWTRNIRSQTKRMSGLMNQLLLLARMDEGLSEIPFELVELSEIVKNTTGCFHELAEVKSIQVHTNIEDEINIQGNKDSLEQLVNIVLDNAVKYTDADGEIIINLFTDGKRYKLTVENTIDELPNAPPSALFDRFYRANVARTQKDGGYGIGLSVAYAIVKMHNGKIDASYIGEHRIKFNIEFEKRH